MMMELSRWLHQLGVVVWVGGMFFAYMALRPAAGQVLPPPMRLPLWHGTLAKFFQWVWLSVGLILASGLHMTRAMGGGDAPLYAKLMLIVGVIMMIVFAHVFFAPFARLGRAVAAQDWPAGGAALGQIRMLVGINLILGLATVTIATAGRAILR
jgi:uncharacterized membrane protein